MGKFILCLDEKEKARLIKNGFKLFKETNMDNKKVFIFINKSKDNLNFNFNKENTFITNKLNF